MWLPADLGDHSDSSDGARLPGGLTALRAQALAAIPSLLDARIIGHRSGATGATTGGPEVARSSLRVALPRSRDAAGVPVSLLLMVASEPGAFTQVAADWAAILDMDPRRLVLDQDLDGTTWADAVEPSVIEQAVGALLDRGLLPDEGRAELERLAAQDGISLAEAAQRFLGGLG